MHLNENELKAASSNDITEALNSAYLFKGIGIEAIGVFLETCSILEIPKSAVLINPETDHKTLYIVLDGRLAVRPNHDDVLLTELTRGQCAGEMSIIENTIPSATVSALSNCRLFVIKEETVWQLISASHCLARNLLEVLSQRLRFGNQHIVDRSKIVEQYRRNAITDSLTDLHNRYWMQTMFARKINRAKTGNQSMCLAVLDLDRFKDFNDEFGHQAGDLLLQSVASALRDLFRPTDLVARFGGDEFAVLLPDTSLNVASTVAERVRLGTIKRILSTSYEHSVVTMSIGLSELFANDSLDTLLDRADQALYRAKERGRNCVST